MSIVVTGATGHLGRLVVEALLERGVPAGRLVATGRRTETPRRPRRARRRRPAGGLRRHGMLREAFAGAEKLLLIWAAGPAGASSSRRGDRRG